MPLIRLLPFQTADGPSNMAADQVMLASASAGTASLRFYGWSSATLSLGYFQPSAPALTYPHLAGFPWLRRQTGGAALVHHHELTYALALPQGPVWQPRGLNWLMRMHEMIRTVLAGRGVDANMCSRQRKYGEVLCFLHHTPGDLLIECGPPSFGRKTELGLAPHKIAGSAQRKQRGALLQHGGILLARSPFTPSLPGIAELSGVAVDGESLMGPLIEELSRAIGCAVEPDNWTPQELERQQSALPRYTSDDWNRRR